MNKLKRRIAAIIIVSAPLFAMVMLAKTMGCGKHAIADYRFIGDKDAPAKVIEFTDMQCPACGYAHKILKKEIGTGFVSVTVRHYPLPFHRWAMLSAVRADCAGEQGKFAEYTASIFENQKAWSGEKIEGENQYPSYFAELEKNLGLDMEKFNACVKNPRTMTKIFADMQYADARRVYATPTFFWGTKKITGGKELAKFLEQIKNRG